jgi:indolepyruvate decarboxylase
VEISHHQYTEVELGEFVAGLAKTRLPKRKTRVRYLDNLKRPARRDRRRPLSVNDMLVEVDDFLAESDDTHVVAESGDMLFGGLEVRNRGRGLYFAQGYYASMGFAIPAAMGAQIGTGIRPLVLCGDGGFQMTGPEIAHAPRHGLSPIVVLVNNGGWGIFRPVTPRKDLLTIPDWPYAELAQAWGGMGAVAECAEDLANALRAAAQLDTFALIECRVPADDLSPLGRRYIVQSAKKSR